MSSALLCIIKSLGKSLPDTASAKTRGLTCSSHSFSGMDNCFLILKTLKQSKGGFKDNPVTSFILYSLSFGTLLVKQEGADMRDEAEISGMVDEKSAVYRF